VTRTAQALTASVGAHAATFQVEAITAHPADLSRAQTYPTGQARCLRPQPNGTTDEWVLALQRVGSGDQGARYIWTDARTQQPVDEAAVAAQLASLYTLAEPARVGAEER